MLWKGNLILSNVCFECYITIEEPCEKNVYSVWGINISQTIVAGITIQKVINKLKGKKRNNCR